MTDTERIDLLEHGVDWDGMGIYFHGITIPCNSLREGVDKWVEMGKPEGGGKSVCLQATLNQDEPGGEYHWGRTESLNAMLVKTAQAVKQTEGGGE